MQDQYAEQEHIDYDCYSNDTFDLQADDNSSNAINNGHLYFKYSKCLNDI